MATTKSDKTSKQTSTESMGKGESKSASRTSSKSAAESATIDTVKNANSKETNLKETKNPAKSSSKSSSNSHSPEITAQNLALSKKRVGLIATLKERLIQERETLLQGMYRKDTPTELSTHGDLVDQSTNFSEHEVMLGMAEHDRNRLHEINHALEKIEKGTYGICEMSGELISDERLMAMPTARYSVKCQAKIEGYG